MSGQLNMASVYKIYRTVKRRIPVVLCRMGAAGISNGSTVFIKDASWRGTEIRQGVFGTICHETVHCLGGGGGEMISYGLGNKTWGVRFTNKQYCDYEDIFWRYI